MFGDIRGWYRWGGGVIGIEWSKFGWCYIFDRVEYRFYNKVFFGFKRGLRLRCFGLEGLEMTLFNSEEYVLRFKGLGLNLVLLRGNVMIL